MKVTVITPTGGRFDSFALCEKYMQRQTIKPDQWIVVDDCEDATPCTMGQEHIHRTPFWKQGDMTLPQNMLAGLEAATGDVVLIMEDDDWYRADYIENMKQRLLTADMSGEGEAKYYNVRNHRHMVHRNMKHASLCQTGFTREIMDQIKDVTHRNIGQKFLDLHLWNIKCNRDVFSRSDSLCVGIKGMPGRGGIGYGHKDTMGSVDARPFRMLRHWIGAEDAEIYYNMMKSSNGGGDDMEL